MSLMGQFLPWEARLLCPRKLPRQASGIAAVKGHKRHQSHSLNHLIGGYQ